MNKNRQTIKMISELMINDSEQLLNKWTNELIIKTNGQQYQNVNEIRNSVINAIVIENVNQ